MCDIDHVRISDYGDDLSRVCVCVWGGGLWKCILTGLKREKENLYGSRVKITLIQRKQCAN